jgi:HlyD family secretion protein
MRGDNRAFRSNKRRRALWGAAILLVTVWMSLSGCRAADAIQINVQRALQAAGLDRAGSQDPIRASGTIQADEVQIASEFGGRIVEMHAEAGQHVRAGQWIAFLDAAALQDELAEAEAAVATAQADLAVLMAGTRPEEIQAARAAVALATARLEGARTSWENARKALQDPQELNARIIGARTQVKLSEQASILAEAQLASQQLLARQKKEDTDERSIADWQVRAAEEALAAAQADRVAAQTLLGWLTYIRNEPLVFIAQANAAQREVQIAEAGVRVAEARVQDLQAGPTAQEIAVARARVRLAQSQAAVLRAQQDRFILRSPVEGVLLEQVLHKGELAAPAATIATVANLDPLRLTVYVPVRQVGYVHLGQQVRVTVDSFPGRIFTGRVTRIGDQPEYTPRNIATQEERANTFYGVDIHLDNPDNALKPGMPADGIFVSTGLSGEPPNP